MKDNDRFGENLFSDRMLKEVAGKTEKDKVKAKEIVDTHTIDVASMTLILGRIEELYKVAAKLNRVGLTAAAIEIEESTGEIEKAVLSNPVDTVDIDDLQKMMDEHNRQHHLPLEGNPIDSRPISIPPYMVGYSSVTTSNTAASAEEIQNNRTEVMRRAYDRLDDQQDD